MNHRLITAVLGAIVFLASLGANASLRSGLFRLHLDSTLLEVATGETKPKDSNSEQDYSGLDVGLGMGRVGVGIGGSLGNGFVVGGTLRLGQESNSWTPGGNDEYFLWAVIPYLEYVFLDRIFRPFVKAHSGLEGLNNDNSSFVGFLLGGGGGAHIFVRESVSIDIICDLTFRFGGGDWHIGNIDGDFSHWRFSFRTGLGLSGWF